MRTRLNLKKLSWLILSLYIIFSCYGAYVLFYQRSSDSSRSVKGSKQGTLGIRRTTTSQSFSAARAPLHREFIGDVWNHSKTPLTVQDSKPDADAKENAVEIWSRAGIGKCGQTRNTERVIHNGQYTWEHILRARLEPRLGGVWSYGFHKEGNMALTFRCGPGVVPNKVPADVENLVLVMNGRAPDKVDFTRVWLDYLDAFPRLRNVGLMLIGSEECDNDWVLQYMASQGGPVKFLFVVYDSPLVSDDARMYQWPLGVATYRGFPVVDTSQLDLRARRPYRCNFMGTVYPNSSRELLLQVVEKHQLDNYCYVKARKSWMPSEQLETRLEYEKVLAQSDLTLSPVGMNAECYRIYEAISYGSIPVIEDTQMPGQCSDEPLRLLKRFKAPVIYLKDWNDLPGLLKDDLGKPLAEVFRRRQELLQWYDTFRMELKEVFLKTIQQSFFPT